jgi:chromosome segregation ATPase
MTSVLSTRRAALTGVVALCLAAIVSGQAVQPAAPARTQMDELLAEVRAIRADLDRAATASLRGQLLGMRPQLQEQRIAAIARQLSDVQERLRGNAQARTALAGPMKMFDAMKGENPGEREQLEAILGPLKQQLVALDKNDADLKAEETLLTSQLHDEQSRWSAFNGQIEEMERAAAGKVMK